MPILTDQPRGTAQLTRLIIAVALICAPGIWGCGISGDEAPLRRVILISCDTLSAQHMPAYGYDRPTTAAFDSLASHGVLFKTCLAPQGWTLSSHMSIFTGLAPGVHRVGMNTALADSVATLPQLLKDAGFRTFGLPQANDWLSEEFGFGRGFHLYRGLSYETVSDLRIPVTEGMVDWFRKEVPLTADDGKAVPFFLFLHYMDVHSRPSSHPFPYWTPNSLHRDAFRMPIDPPAPMLKAEADVASDTTGLDKWDLERYDPELLRRGYDACVMTWDRMRLEKVLTLLNDTGHLDDTLVIVTADHGEELGEHGGYYHDSPYGEVREVPLLVLWPGRLPEGTVVDQPVSLMDILPTILDYADIEPPKPCQGESLRPLLEDATVTSPQREFLVDGIWRNYKLEPAAFVAWDDGDWWSLVVMPDTTGTTDNFQPATLGSVIGLYDLTRDPYETNNLIKKRPRLVSRLQDRFTAQMAMEAELARLVAEGGPSEEVTISPEAKRKLKALGY